MKHKVINDDIDGEHDKTTVAEKETVVEKELDLEKKRASRQVDVTSDDDSDEDDVFVEFTNTDGDAHIPAESQPEHSGGIKENNQDKTEDVLEIHITEATDDDATEVVSELVDTEDPVETVTLSNNSETLERITEDTISVVDEENNSLTQDNEKTDGYVNEEKSKDNQTKERTKEEDSIKTDLKVGKKDEKVLTDTNKKQTAEDSRNVTERRPDTLQPPVPAPRRSSRERKPPSRFAEYHMNLVVPRPYDNKIHAMNILMSSGVLNEVDTEVAHRLLEAVMK